MKLTYDTSTERAVGVELSDVDRDEQPTEYGGSLARVPGRRHNLIFGFDRATVEAHRRLGLPDPFGGTAPSASAGGWAMPS